MKALSALTYVHCREEKWGGDIKARTCAVRSKQHTFPGYVKLEWASPTVSMDGVIITSTIEAHQGREIAIADLSNAFLEQTLILLKGKLAELMVQIDPKVYRKYIITISKGEHMLYIHLSKALYGCFIANCDLNWRIMDLR